MRGARYREEEIKAGWKGGSGGSLGGDNMERGKWWGEEAQGISVGEGNYFPGELSSPKGWGVGRAYLLTNSLTCSLTCLRADFSLVGPSQATPSMALESARGL